MFYGDGRSERLLAQLKRDRKEDIIHRHQGRSAIGPACRRWVHCAKPDCLYRTELKNLATDTLDLVQLHCRRPMSITGLKFFRRWMIW